MNGPGLEEPALLADALELAVERHRARAVPVAEQPPVRVGGPSGTRARSPLAGRPIVPLVAGLDRLGDLEVPLGHRAIRDASLGQGHAHRPVTEQSGDRLDGHASVDDLGGQRVTKLVGSTWPIPARRAMVST